MSRRPVYLETYRGPVELPVARPNFPAMIGTTMVAGVVFAAVVLWSICTFANGGCELTTSSVTTVAAGMF